MKTGISATLIAHAGQAVEQLGGHRRADRDAEHGAHHRARRRAAPAAARRRAPATRQANIGPSSHGSGRPSEAEERDADEAETEREADVADHAASRARTIARAERDRGSPPLKGLPRPSRAGLDPNPARRPPARGAATAHFRRSPDARVGWRPRRPARPLQAPVNRGVQPLRMAWKSTVIRGRFCRGRRWAQICRIPAHGSTSECRAFKVNRRLTGPGRRTGDREAPHEVLRPAASIRRNSRAAIPLAPHLAGEGV